MDSCPPGPVAGRGRSPAGDAWPVWLPGLFSALILADGRLPSGSYAHSGGLEALVELEPMDVDQLGEFLRGRLHGVGLTSAAVAVAAWRMAQGSSGKWSGLQGEVDARIPSRAQRETSRRQGRQLARVGRTAWPSSALGKLLDELGDEPHVPLVQGVLGHCAGLDPVALATVVLYEVLTVPAAAAIRLLGLDPLSVTAQAVALEDDVNWLAVEAARSGSASLGELPAPASPRLDLLSEMQFMMEGRLFAS